MCVCVQATYVPTAFNLICFYGFKFYDEFFVLVSWYCLYILEHTIEGVISLSTLFFLTAIINITKDIMKGRNNYVLLLMWYFFLAG